MQIDFAKIPSIDAYKLLTGLVVPRPIAWVTTLHESGEVNAAPFSFFNVFGSRPPLAIIGTGRRPDGTLKDTTENLQKRSYCVVHLVEEAFAEAMSQTSASLAPGDSEIQHAGLELEKIGDFPVPAIRGTRARLLAKCIDQPTYGENQLNVLEVLQADIDDAIIDSERVYIKSGYAPIGRLAGNGYCTSKDRFEITRPS